MKIVIHGPMMFKYTDILRKYIKVPCEIEKFNCTYNNKEFLEALKKANILVSMEWPNYLTFPKNIRLFQVPGIGLDKISFFNIPKDVPICIAPKHEEAVSEYIIMTILIWLREFKKIEESFRKGSWEMSSRTGGPPTKQLKGKKVGIVGYGKIGKNLSQKLEAFGAKIYCANRSKIKKKDFINKFYHITEINDMLTEVDIVVICIALTPATQNIINSESFNSMKPHTLLVNVARGECVEENSLFEACKNKKIAGAIIDVWYSYPTAINPEIMPSKYPFHQLENIIMSPHISAWTEELVEQRLKIIAKNINNIFNNKKLLHLLPRGMQ